MNNFASVIISSHKIKIRCMKAITEGDIHIILHPLHAKNSITLIEHIAHHT